VAVSDWSDDQRPKKWFEADTFPMGIVCKLSSDRVNQLSSRDDLLDHPITRSLDHSVQITSAGESFEIPEYDLPVSGRESEWALVPPDAGAILRRLRRSFPPLAIVLGRKPVMGVKTGDNRNFFLDVRRVSDGRVVTSEGVHIPMSAVCRCVRGRDLRQWRLDASHWMLWPPPNGWHRPPRWLMHFAEKRGLTPDAIRLSFVKPEHVGIKVAWKDLSRGVAACVLPDSVDVHGVSVPLVPNQTLYSIDAASLDEAYAIAAILNSTVAGALLLSVAERAKDAHYRYFGRTVAAMPYPDARSEWDALVRLSRRAHRGADVHDAIDAIVARLYGVSEDELAMLRRFVERRLGAR
jgi:hypothetical protein